MAESGSPTPSDISPDEASESELLDRSLSVWKGWSPVGKEDFDPIPLDTHTASSIGQYECVNNLIARGVPSLDKKNRGGWTPLMYASYIGHDNIVKLLLDAEVDVNLKNNKGHTPLMLAASCGNESVGYYLCQYVAELESRDDHGWTALFHATYAGHQNMVRFLLEQGANINAVEPAIGTTPFMEAAAEGHEIIVQLFLQHGVNVNAKTYNSDTARSLALSNGHTKIVSLIDNYVMPITCLRTDPGFEADLSSSDETSQKNKYSTHGPRGRGKGPSIFDGPQAIAKLIDRTGVVNAASVSEQHTDVNSCIPQGYVTFPQSDTPSTTHISYRDVTSPINPQDYNLDSSGDKDSMDNEDDRSAFSQTGAITIKSSSSSSGGLVAALGISRESSVESDDDLHSKKIDVLDKQHTVDIVPSQEDQLVNDPAILDIKTLVREDGTPDVWLSNTNETCFNQRQDYGQTDVDNTWSNLKPLIFSTSPKSRFNECWKNVEASAPNNTSPDNSTIAYQPISNWKMEHSNIVASDENQKQICDLVSHVAISHAVPNWDICDHDKSDKFITQSEAGHLQREKSITYSGDFDNIFNHETLREQSNVPGLSEFKSQNHRLAVSIMDNETNTQSDVCVGNIKKDVGAKTMCDISKPYAHSAEQKTISVDNMLSSESGACAENDISKQCADMSSFSTLPSQMMTTVVPINNHTPVTGYQSHSDFAYSKLMKFQDHGHATTKKDTLVAAEPFCSENVPSKDLAVQHVQNYQITDPQKLYFPPNIANTRERREIFQQRDVFWSKRPSRSDRPQDLSTLLEQLGMSKYLHVFEEQDVDLQVFLSLTDNDLKEIGIRLFGPRKKMTNAIARWHSNAQLLTDDLEQAYADRLENEMQEMALQLTQAYEEVEKLNGQVGKEQQLRSVTESCLMEERAAWQHVHRIIMETRQHCEDMCEMLGQMKLYQSELKQRLYNDRHSCPGQVHSLYKMDLPVAMQDDMMLDKVHDKDLATDTLIRKTELYANELQQSLTVISISMDRLLGRKAIQP